MDGVRLFILLCLLSLNNLEYSAALCTLTLFSTAVCSHISGSIPVTLQVVTQHTHRQFTEIFTPSLPDAELLKVADVRKI